jgi:hypothetical protein
MVPSATVVGAPSELLAEPPTIGDQRALGDGGGAGVGIGSGRDHGAAAGLGQAEGSGDDTIAGDGRGGGPSLGGAENDVVIDRQVFPTHLGDAGRAEGDIRTGQGHGTDGILVAQAEPRHGRGDGERAAAGLLVAGRHGIHVGLPSGDVGSGGGEAAHPVAGGGHLAGRERGGVENHLRA